MKLSAKVSKQRRAERTALERAMLRELRLTSIPTWADGAGKLDVLTSTTLWGLERARRTVAGKGK